MLLYGTHAPHAHHSCTAASVLGIRDRALHSNAVNLNAFTSFHHVLARCAVHLGSTGVPMALYLEFFQLH